MGEPIQAKVDLSSMKAGLAQLLGPARESIARTMAAAGGRVIRDEAKERVPRVTGTLADAIYLAYKQDRSTEALFVYSISWNSRKAPHGHLVELGHWQTNVVVRTKSGQYITTDRKLASPRWIAPKAFLRPALDSAGSRAFEAMMKAGRARMFDLLADAGDLEDTSL
ncbi:HK97 gp10 family phage protein [Luteibacter sp. PPL552]